MTDEEAEALRLQLAQHEAQQAADAVIAENQRRADQLAAIQPATDVIYTEDWSNMLDNLQNAFTAINLVDWDLANLINNCLNCARAARERIDRRIEDLQPSPVPEIPQSLEPEPTQ